MRRPIWILAAALGASLAFNAWWLVRGERAGARPPQAAARVGAVAMERCRAAVASLGGWSVRMRVAWPSPVDRENEEPSASGDGDAGATNAPGSAAPDAGASARHDSEREVERELCDITTQHMRDEWRRDRDKIARDIQHALADGDKQRGDERQEVARAADAIGLDARDRPAFEESYVGIRRERVGALLDALGDDTVDYAELHANAVELFREQDDLVQSRYGDEALRRFRAEELRGRALILAILSSTAEVPWEQGVAW